MTSIGDATEMSEIAQLQAENAKLRRALAEADSAPTTFEAASLRELIRTALIVELGKQTDGLFARISELEKLRDALLQEVGEATRFAGYEVNRELSEALVAVMELPDKWCRRRSGGDDRRDPEEIRVECATDLQNALDRSAADGPAHRG